MKDFKIAHIVPRGCLEYTRCNHYHMCLAHLVHEEQMDHDGTGDRRYTEFYRCMSDEGKFVLMDNGAAEGSQLSVDDLLVAYDAIRPTEIVVPDTLGDGDDTIKKMKAFVSEHGDLPYRFMGVPQGRTLNEWIECAEQMVRNWRIDTIGVSKFLNVYIGDKWARYSAVAALVRMMDELGRKDLEVHLLGCHEGPDIVRTIRKAFPVVRGCDTAYAYLASKANGRICGNRPEGEIDFLHGCDPGNLSDCLFETNARCGVLYNDNGKLWSDTVEPGGQYYVSKRMEIAGAHNLQLPYKSKCTQVHGHNWIVTVHCVANRLTSYGMVVDFTKVKEAIHDVLDHSYINEVIEDNPTAENMAKWICDRVTELCRYGCCYKVEVQESEGNVATYVRGGYEA